MNPSLSDYPVVCFDYRENRKAPLPAALRNKISELENTPGAVKA